MVTNGASSQAFNVNFQGKHADEAFQFYSRQHWIRLLWPFIRMVLLNIAVFTLSYVLLEVFAIEDVFARRGLLIFVSFAFVFINLDFLLRFYNYFLYVVVVTDKRVHRIKKKLLTIDDHQSVDIWVLQDIQKNQHGIVQNVLGFGSLILQAQESEVRLHFVPRISQKYHMLMNLREQGRARMGYSMRQTLPKTEEKVGQPA